MNLKSASAGEAPSSQAPRRAYYTIDAVRGVGALLVMTRHAKLFFNPDAAPETFLAVDLFYLISGFIIAHAYGDRLRAGGFAGVFLKTRLIRLYPLYLLAMAVSVVAALYSAITDPAGWWTISRVIQAVALGLVLMPLAPGVSVNGSSLNGPTWTLLPELLANLAFALLAPVLRRWMLAGVILGCAAALIFAEIDKGTLDVGYDAGTFLIGLCRAGFSFFVGVALFQMFGARQHTSLLGACVCVAGFALLLAARPAARFVAPFELGAVLVGFPLLLIAAVHFEPGARTGRLFARIGDTSYGLYLLHQPVAKLIGFAAARYTLHYPLAWGAAFALALAGLTQWLAKYYDAPLRRALTARFIPGRRAPRAPPA